MAHRSQWIPDRGFHALAIFSQSNFTGQVCHYELVTQMTDEYGAAEGEHQVLISKLNGKPGVAETGANETLPARYSNPRDLELRAIVKPEPNVFNFDLTVKKQ